MRQVSLTPAVMLGFLGLTGCVRVDVPDPSPGGGGNPPLEGVTIRFVNESPFALDPQFYASPDVLGDPEVILFTPANFVGNGFGFAGRGTLDAGEVSQITLDCEEARTIGTRGGEFLNLQNGSVVGAGQQKFTGIQQTYNCGSIVSFYFTASGTRFTTTIAAE